MSDGSRVLVTVSGVDADCVLFRQGDVDAFESLFRLHQRAVYGWILRIVRNPAVASVAVNVPVPSDRIGFVGSVAVGSLLVK